MSLLPLEVVIDGRTKERHERDSWAKGRGFGKELTKRNAEERLGIDLSAYAKREVYVGLWSCKRKRKLLRLRDVIKRANVRRRKETERSSLGMGSHWLSPSDCAHMGHVLASAGIKALQWIFTQRDTGRRVLGLGSSLSRLGPKALSTNGLMNSPSLPLRAFIRFVWSTGPLRLFLRSLGLSSTYRRPPVRRILRSLSSSVTPRPRLLLRLRLAALCLLSRFSLSRRLLLSSAMRSLSRSMSDCACMSAIALSARVASFLVIFSCRLPKRSLFLDEFPPEFGESPVPDTCGI